MTIKIHFSTKNLSRVLILSFLSILNISSSILGSEGSDAKVVMDALNREVTLLGNYNRAIAIGPGALRLLVYLDLLNRVAAVESFEDSNESGRPYLLANAELIQAKPSVTPGGASQINKMPDIEKIMSIKPDIIISHLLDRVKADRLQKLTGIPVVAISYGPFATFDDTVFDTLIMLGEVFNVQKRAEEVVHFIKNARSDIRKRTADLKENKLKRAYIGGIGRRGTQGIGSTDADYVPFSWLKLNNVTGDVVKEGHVHLNLEKLLVLNPEHVFVDAGGLEVIREDYGKKKAIYNAIKAFQQEKVYVLLPFNFYTTNIGTVVVNAYVIGKKLYPDKFEDINIKKVSDQIFEFLVGKSVYSDMCEIYGEPGEKFED